MELILKHICGRCRGTGIEPTGPGGPSNGCLACGGDGELYWGHADALMDELDEIDTKLDALDTKMDTLDTHLDTIETKIDALE